MKKVLVVDDGGPIPDIAKFNLVKGGYDAYTVYDREEALGKVAEAEPDLILLNSMLPKMDGLEVAREVRKTYDMPIIMVTARDSKTDKVLGLELGVDDYVTKPFPNRESVTRVKINLRRGATAVKEPGEAAPAELTIDNLTIHPGAYMVTKRGETIELTHREFELLSYSAKHFRQVMTREHLLQTVWDYDYFGDVRTVDVTIRRLRGKTGDNPSHSNHLVIRRGVGYYLCNPEQEQLDEKKSPFSSISQF